MKYGCLLFDLDGTLIDSLADITTSVNLMLREFDRLVLPESAVTGLIGEGVRTLVERALLVGVADLRNSFPSPAEVEMAMAAFRRHYRDHLFDTTTTYPGVFETLRYFDRLPKAVVTNKPVEFARAVLQRLDLSPFFVAVVGGDSLPQRKPSPEPLLEAARLCGVSPEECLVIGDSPVDVIAARAAGMSSCGFTGGFCRRDDIIAAGAVTLIDEIRALRDIVGPW
jgi:phosphoglycolate phosphatase